MNRPASKNQMENSIELLGAIQRAEASEDLLTRIEQRIDRAKNNVVPMFWVKVAAAAFICLFSAQLYLLSNPTEKDNLNQMIQIADNTLYCE